MLETLNNIHSNPRNISITPNGRFAYITTMGSGTVTVLDMQTHKITTQIPVPVSDIISIMAGPYVGTDGLAYRFYEEVLDRLDYTGDDMDLQMAKYHENIHTAETLLDAA